MTYRERRQRRVERLQEWAGKREDKSEQSFDKAFQRVEHIPAGQPILVGHHSERGHRRTLELHDQDMRAGFEHRQKAEEMRGRAENIADQLDTAIYGDDPDAIEQLQARVDRLEAQRDRVKAYNASCRKGSPDFDLLDEKQRKDIQSYIDSGYSGGKIGFPGFALSNLGGTITRNRKRLEALKRRKQREERAKELAQQNGGI